MKSLLQIFVITTSLLFWSDVSALIASKEATYYADAFEGRSTSNGEIFSHSGFTVALCDVPLGKNIYAFTSSTGVLVRVNDRPNCSRYPNIIDFSKSTFSLFAPLSRGRIVDLQVDTLETLDPYFFQDLGVVLESISTTYFAGEVAEFRGRVIDGKKNIILFLQHEKTKEESTQLFPVDSSGRFTARITLPRNTGKYAFVIASGNSFETDIVSSLHIVTESIITPSLPVISQKITPKIDTVGGVPSLSLGSNIWGGMTLKQDTKSYTMSGTRFLFDGFSQFRTGKADVRISGYLIGSGGSLDRLAQTPSLYSGSVLLDRTHEKIGAQYASIRNYKTYTTLKFRVPNSPKIRDAYFLTLPSGDVREFDFAPQYIGSGGYLIPGKTITLTLPTTEDGTYLVESVKQDGTAYFNLPITRGTVWNILAPYSSDSAKMIRKDIKLVESTIVSRINKLRASLGRSLLMIDADLTRLAQAKAEDMVKRKYYGHIDPDGGSIGTLAKKIGLTIRGEIRENIAYGKGEVGDIVLQDGLEESGSHRFSMLIPNYTKVGVGYIRSGDETFIVQVFGE